MAGSQDRGMATGLHQTKSMLPGKARAMLDPFEELSSKILFTWKDLDTFLRQWGGLQSRLQELRLHITRDEQAAHGWLDEMVRMQRSLRLESRIHEWRVAYSRLRHRLPSKYQLLHAKFDALSNRALYSREPLQRFWNNTVDQLKDMRLWNVDRAARGSLPLTAHTDEVSKGCV